MAAVDSHVTPTALESRSAGADASHRLLIGSGSFIEA
jgi:hypothetical protein